MPDPSREAPHVHEGPRTAPSRPFSLVPASEHTLLVATTGGHLDELERLSDRLFPVSRRVTWVTHPDPQASSLLSGHEVLTVPYIPPRGYAQLARAVPSAVRHLRSTGADRVVSTGAGIALPYFLAARALGVSCHYVESAARGTGPSLTGKISARMPGVNLYTQYASWADERWHFRGSVFDDFEVVPGPVREVSRVVVTLGTIRPFGFRRLLARLARVLPEVLTADAEVLWQVGATDPRGLGLAGEVHEAVPSADLRQAVAAADLVVSHAGVGSALTAFELGRRPVLVPRRVAHREHVDDHQTFITDGLRGTDLAVPVEADELRAEHLLEATRGSITSSRRPQPIQLSSRRLRVA